MTAAGSTTADARDLGSDEAGHASFGLDWPSVGIAAWGAGEWNVSERAHHVLIVATAGVVAYGVEDGSGRRETVSVDGVVTFLPFGQAWRVTVAARAPRAYAVTIPDGLVAMACGQRIDQWRASVAERQPRLVEAAKWLVRPRIGSHCSDDLLARLLGRLVATAFGGFVRRVDDSWLPAAALARVASLCASEDLRELSVPAMAGHAGLGVSAFARAFRGSTGLTPGEYLIRLRIGQVAEMLAATDLPVSAIAKETGLSGVAHLTQQFGERFGMTPGRYRAALRSVRSAS